MKRFQIAAAIIAILCAISFGASALIIGGMAGKLASQTAAQRWAGDDTKLAQISAFISPEEGLRADALERSLPTGIDSGLTEWSIAPANDSARIYAYAYSAEGDVSMMRVGDYGKVVKSGVSARAVACGKDFFLFHPLKLLSGHYFSTTDTLNDYVIIDNDLAWQFFGSADVVGRELVIGSRVVYISGVCESGSDGDYAEFYGEKPRVFLPYSLAEELLGSLPITTVEIVLPDPITNFAMGLFQENLGVSENYVEFIENSARFSDTYLLDLLTNSASRGIRLKPVAYPYWENTAVLLTNAAATVFLFKLLPIVIIALLIAAEIVLLYIMRKKIIRYFGDKLQRAKRSFQQNRRKKSTDTSSQSLKESST